MDFIQLLASNFGFAIMFLIFVIAIVSIVLGILLEFYKTTLKARQRMQELRNEELRLRLQLEHRQPKNEPLADSQAADISQLQEMSWAEQPQAHYQAGYQQQR
jgi:membrane protein insertase Oxa1/YidC/SpoIIIJ